MIRWNDRVFSVPGLKRHTRELFPFIWATILFLRWMSSLIGALLTTFIDPAWRFCLNDPPLYPSSVFVSSFCFVFCFFCFHCGHPQFRIWSKVTQIKRMRPYVDTAVTSMTVLMAQWGFESINITSFQRGSSVRLRWYHADLKNTVLFWNFAAFRSSLM